MVKTVLPILLLASILSGCQNAQTPTVSASQKTPVAAPDLDATIQFHLERVKNDPQGALGWAMLAESHLAKARAQDDDDSALLAQTAAEKSLQIRTRNNARASLALVQALLAQHEFEKANLQAEKAHKSAPNDPSILRILAETHLELGKYKQFQSLLPRLEQDAQNPEAAVVIARWEDITGNPERALALLQSAVQSVAPEKIGNPTVASAYTVHLADHYRKYENWKNALDSYNQALLLDPDNYKAYAGLTKVHAHQKDWMNVKTYGQKTAEFAKMTDVMALVAESHRQTGDQSAFELSWVEIDRLNHSDHSADHDHHDHQGHHAADHHHEVHAEAEGRHTHNRLYSIALAEARRNLKDAHHIAEEDLRSRQDIEAYDTFAWATFLYYQTLTPTQVAQDPTLLEEAKKSIKAATQWGTKDPKIRSHFQQIMASPDPS